MTVEKQTTGSLSVEQHTFVVPDVPIQELLGVLPPHCFKRSTLRSFTYVVWDASVIFCLYKATVFLDSLMFSAIISTIAYRFARFALWSLYGFSAGIFGGGLWVIGHECGHRAFSESKIINDSVGLIIHTALGVPYFSWRISHAQHHASAGHMTKDQPHVPFTRSGLGLPLLDLSHEDHYGSQATEEARKALWDALGESPVATALRSAAYCLLGWPLYLLINFHGPAHYPKGTNHFDPRAVIFRSHQFWQVVGSNLAMLSWIGGLAVWASKRGVWEVLSVYGVPYLWVNHWLVLITLLHHTDPLLPHYRGSEFTFVRGALATFDRSLLAGSDTIIGRIFGIISHGISDNHVVHHVCSKIPHYHAWEASAALRKFLRKRGIELEGAPVSWAEGLRVWRECRFVEDEGDIVFYKNAHGVARMRPTIYNGTTEGSGSKLQM